MGVVIHQILAESDLLLLCSPTDVRPLAANADVARDQEIARGDTIVGGVVFVQLPEFRIAFTVRRLVVLHLVQALLHGLVDHVVPDGRLVHTAAVHVQRRLAVHKNVVLHGHVPPAPDEGRACSSNEQIAVDGLPTHAVVQIDGHGTHAVAAGVVDVIVANDVATGREVAARVDRTAVASLERDVMDLVELDHTLVGMIEDRGVRRVMDQVVGHTNPDPVEQNRRRIAARPSAEVVEVIVVDIVATGSEGLAVPAG